MFLCFVVLVYSLRYRRSFDLGALLVFGRWRGEGKVKVDGD